MNENQKQLPLDTSVMTSKDEVQEVESIDQKYGVELFTEPVKEYELYQYEAVNQQIYDSNREYAINLDTNQFEVLYTQPIVYPVDTMSETIDMTRLLIVILIIQIIVVVYFASKIIKVKVKNENSYS